MAYAEDELEDELVDVEGEVDEGTDDVAITEEDDEEVKTTTSPDADTTILFIKPITTGSSQMGMFIIFYFVFKYIDFLFFDRITWWTSS